MAPQGIVYKRTSPTWHQLDLAVGGRRLTFFGYSFDQVLAKAGLSSRTLALNLRQQAGDETAARLHAV